MKQIQQFIILLAVLIISPSALSQAIDAKGMATIEYSSRFGPSSKEKSEAVRQAKINALERHVANASQSKMNAYESHRNEIESALDDYLLQYSVISEDTDKGSRRYQVVIKTSINANRLNSFLDSKSSIGTVSSDEASYMTFMFVARTQKSVKSYDARVVKREDSKSAIEGSEFESSSGPNVEYQASESSTKLTESGGSTTQKSDIVEYDVFSAEGINSAMSEVFATVGFEVVEAEYLEEESNGLVSIDAFISDYSSGDDLSGATKRNAAKGLKELEIPYMAIGTLDVGIRDTDPTSGLVRVYVTVNGQVLDVSKRFPKKVAAVGPVQHAGLGPTEQVARNNALKIAAKEAARELTNQMNAKDIH
jgi:predicted heme/steroid binding protein